MTEDKMVPVEEAQKIDGFGIQDKMNFDGLNKEEPTDADENK